MTTEIPPSALADWTQLLRDRDAWCERAAELTAEVNSLRLLVTEILDRTWPEGEDEQVHAWLQRAGLEQP